MTVITIIRWIKIFYFKEVFVVTTHKVDNCQVVSVLMLNIPFAVFKNIIDMESLVK